MSTAPTGFVRVPCSSCGRTDVWLTCNSCGRSDYFAVAEGIVVCECSATYDHAVCTCGSSVPGAELLAVGAQDGPIALADTEWAWGRIAAMVALLVTAAGVTVFLLFT